MNIKLLIDLIEKVEHVKDDIELIDLYAQILAALDDSFDIMSAVKKILDSVSDQDLFEVDGHTVRSGMPRGLLSEIGRQIPYPKGVKQRAAMNQAFGGNDVIPPLDLLIEYSKDYSDVTAGIISNMADENAVMELLSRKQKLEQDIQSINGADVLAYIKEHHPIVYDDFYRVKSEYNILADGHKSTMRYKEIESRMDEISKEICRLYRENNNQFYDKVNELRAIEETINNGGIESEYRKILDDIGDGSASKINIDMDSSARRSIMKTGYQDSSGKMLVGISAVEQFNADIEEFNRITRGRIKSISIVKSEARAHASGVVTSADGGFKINVGRGLSKRILWHELGHMLERDPKAMSVSQAYLKYRRKSDKVEKMNAVMGSRDYQDDELAYAGDFPLTPYMGKLYGNGLSEVFSLAMEMMSSPRLFKELLCMDKQLADVILSYLHDDIDVITDTYLKADEEYAKRFEKYTSQKYGESNNLFSITKDFSLSINQHLEDVGRQVFEFICMRHSGFKRGQKFKLYGFVDFSESEQILIAQFNSLKIDGKTVKDGFVVTSIFARDGGKVSMVQNITKKVERLTGNESVNQAVHEFINLLEQRKQEIEKWNNT